MYALMDCKSKSRTQAECGRDVHLNKCLVSIGNRGAAVSQQYTLAILGPEGIQHPRQNAAGLNVLFDLQKFATGVLQEQDFVNCCVT